MTYSNEIKLLNEIAKKQLGNTRFCTKYGIDISELKNIFSKDEISETELNRANEIFIKNFTDEVCKKLSSDDVPDGFFTDLFDFINA